MYATMKKIISILLSSAMIFSMGISTVSAAAADDTAATESIVVSKTEGITDTAYGKVRGFIDNGTYTFRGIPYAKADRFEMWKLLIPGMMSAIVLSMAQLLLLQK